MQTFTAAGKWTQPDAQRPRDDTRSPAWPVHRPQGDSATKGRSVTHVTAWTNPEGLKLSGRSQTQRAEPEETASGEKAAECPGAGRARGWLLGGAGFLSGVGNILGSAATVAWLCEPTKSRGTVRFKGGGCVRPGAAESSPSTTPHPPPPRANPLGLTAPSAWVTTLSTHPPSEPLFTCSGAPARSDAKPAQPPAPDPSPCSVLPFLRVSHCLRPDRSSPCWCASAGRMDAGPRNMGPGAWEAGAGAP